MRRYISTLHTKSPAHKKRFALLVASSVTLVIFSFWSTIRFGEPTIVAQDERAGSLVASPSGAVTPFENVLSGLKSAWQNLLDITNGRGQ